MPAKPTEKAAKPAEDPKAKAAATPEPEPPAEPVVPAEEPEEKEDAPEPEEPKAPVDGKDDPLLASIFADLKEEKEPEFKKVAEEPEPEPAKEEEKPAEEPAEPEVKEEPAKKPRKQSRVITDPPPAPAAHVPAPAPTPEPPKPPVDPDAEYVASLNEDQQDELAEARKAETMFPERYKGREKKLIAWYKDLDATGEKLKAENPDRTFDQDDADFQKFLRTKPHLTPLDSKKVQRAIVEESVTTKLKAEQDTKNAEIERRQKAIELKPEIDDIEKQVRTGIAQAIEGDVGELIRKEGFEKAKELFPLDATIIEQTVNQAANLSREYTALAGGIKSFDATNPDHQWVLKFINEQGQIFSQKGGAARVDAKGRQFLSRADFSAATRNDPQVNDKYWTFSHRSIIEMIGINAKQQAEDRIKKTIEDAKRLGFERPTRKVSTDPKKPEKAEKPEPEPITPPKAGLKPSKGPATTKAKEANTGDSINIVEALGLRS